MTLPAEGTLLILDGMGIPLYSARGLTMAVQPISGAISMDRDINGNLVDLSNPNFRKYAIKITCTDQRAVVPDSFWPGMAVTVHSVHEFHHAVGANPTRSVVSGSLRTEGNYVFYRPIFYCMVMNDPAQTSEWSADVQWELDLEEI